MCAEVPDSLEECLDLYCNAGANEVSPAPGALRAASRAPALARVCAGARAVGGGLGCWRLLPLSQSCR